MSLYAAVLVGVLAADFQVNVYSLVASVGVLGVVIGFAVQQTLGDIFSGLALQLQRPFDHGDWVRSGQFLGRVQSVGVRSTTIITRGNERLEIPNSAIAKEVLTNYGAPPVCDEISIGISYNEPPNRVREVILKVMGDVQHVLTGSFARGAGVGVRRFRRSSIESSTGFPTTLCRNRYAIRW